MGPISEDSRLNKPDMATLINVNSNITPNPAPGPASLAGGETSAWPPEAEAALNRVALYLRAAGLASAEAETKARLAVRRALEAAEAPLSLVGLFKESLAQSQIFIVSPLARPRPLSLGHMLPEGFEDTPRYPPAPSAQS